MALKSNLIKFSQRLAADSEEHRKTGEAVAARIFKLLQKKRTDVDRYVISGTLGARWSWSEATALDSTSPADFDMVIFLRQHNPPFQQVLCEFADIFSKNLDYSVVNSSHSQYIGIATAELKFHIFPAIDLQSKTALSSDTPKAQFEATMSIIQNSARPFEAGRLYSSSLAESAVELVKTQSEFVHSLITLARFWVREVQLDDELFIHGRSYLVECLSIYVAQKSKKKEDLLEAFNHFLALVTNFPKLRVSLLNEAMIDYFKDFKGPVVLDPVNPYNNLAIFRSELAVQEEIVSCIQTAGMSTLWRFEAAKNGNIKISSEDDIAGLFAQRKMQSLRTQARIRLPGNDNRRNAANRRGLLYWILLIILLPLVLLRWFASLLKRKPALLLGVFTLLFAAKFLFNFRTSNGH